MRDAYCVFRSAFWGCPDSLGIPWYVLQVVSARSLCWVNGRYTTLVFHWPVRFLTSVDLSGKGIVEYNQIEARNDADPG